MLHYLTILQSRKIISFGKWTCQPSFMRVWSFRWLRRQMPFLRNAPRQRQRTQTCISNELQYRPTWSLRSWWWHRKRAYEASGTGWGLAFVFLVQVIVPLIQTLHTTVASKSRANQTRLSSRTKIKNFPILWKLGTAIAKEPTYMSFFWWQ